MLTRAGKRRPDLSTAKNSSSKAPFFAASKARWTASVSVSPGAKRTSEAGRPTTSLDSYPYWTSAPRLHARIAPEASVATIA